MIVPVENLQNFRNLKLFRNLKINGAKRVDIHLLIIERASTLFTF